MTKDDIYFPKLVKNFEVHEIIIHQVYKLNKHSLRENFLLEFILKIMIIDNWKK